MKWIMISVLALAANMAQADAWIKCEGCTAPQMLAKSQLHVLEGVAVVYDAAAPSALKFSNQQVVIGGPECHQLRPGSANPGSKTIQRTLLPAISSASDCRTTTISNSEPLTIEDSTVLNALHSIHAQTNGRMKSIIELNANDANLGPGPVTTRPDGVSFGPSAADYANNAVFRAAVDNYAARFTQHSPSITTAAVNTYVNITQPWNIISSIVGTMWLGEDATITVVVTFDDGSKVVLDFEFETPDIAGVKAMKDAEGRDIMTASNASEFSNSSLTFQNGGSAALENWIANAQFLGIEVVSVTGTPSVSGGSCRRTADGVTCTRLRSH